MNKFVAIVYTFVVIISTPLFAQDDEHYIRLIINEKTSLHQLTKLISIDDVVADTVYAYCNAHQWNTLQKMNFTIEELPHPSSLYRHIMADSPDEMKTWDKYPTYAAYLQMMKQYSINYPDICMLDTFGYSVNGKQLLALKISNNVHQREDKPKFFYTSTMHGDETVGYVMLLRLAEYLLTNYNDTTAAGQRVSNIVNNIELWINPLANPDGSYRLGDDTTVNHARRYNANGADLNRDFPDRIDDTVNTTEGRQKETKAMMEFCAKHRFNLSANFHGGAQVVNYPYDNGTPSGTYSLCPEDAWFIHLSRIYATPNPDIMNGGFTNGITNGCEWYAIFGGRQDWMYHWYGGRETTIELSNIKNPAGSTLPQKWENNKESLLAYIEESLKGIRGIVTDGQNNHPLRAKIEVQSIPSSPVFSDSAVGDYHRFILPGTYNLIISAAGYFPDTVANVVVTDTAVTYLNIALQQNTVFVPNELRVQQHEFSVLQNYPNPFNPTTAIGFSLLAVGNVSLKVYNILGQEVAVLLNNETMEAGKHSISFDASNLAGGVYLYRLTTESTSQAQKMIITK
jgi:hypothetical protein